MAFAISGDGYLWPWTTSNLIERAEKIAEFAPVMKCCRETFPIADDSEEEHSEGWRWGVRETG